MPALHAGVRAAAVVVSGLLFAAPAHAASTQPATAKQPNGGKTASQPCAFNVEVINGNTHVVRQFWQTPSAATSGAGADAAKGTAPKRMPYKLQSFNCIPAQQAAPSRALKSTARKSSSAAPETYRAAILNGTHAETKVFPSSVDDMRPAPNANGHVPPVVVGIASSRTITEQASLRPVVIGVASSVADASSRSAQPVAIGIASSGIAGNRQVTRPVAIGVATSGSAGSQPVATDFAPRPPRRRPYYRPDPQ